MWTGRPRSPSRAFVVALAAAALAFARPALADDDAIRARYPMKAATADLYAGVAIDKIAFPDLRTRTRDDRTAERGGITIAFADASDKPRVVVTVVVAKDAAGARAFVDTTLRGVSGALAPSAIDEVAFADAADRYLVATRGNIAYLVDTLDSGRSASGVAALVKSGIARGTPTFPEAKIVVEPSIDSADRRGAPLAVTAPSASVRVRATGAQVVAGGARIRAHGPGPIEIVATATDALGRVTEVRATTTAR